MKTWVCWCAYSGEYTTCSNLPYFPIDGLIFLNDFGEIIDPEDLEYEDSGEELTVCIQDTLDGAFSELEEIELAIPDLVHIVEIQENDNMYYPIRIIE
jgi:hypothetical protein